MNYEYSGYLRSILSSPEAVDRDQLGHVLFTGDDFANWRTRDIASEKGWRRVPAQRMRTETGVRIVGKFHEIRQIDNLAVDAPGFWAPLSNLGASDPRFPIDLAKHPIAEITYRCTSDNAFPAWMWCFEGAREIEFLPQTPRWHTVARRIGHNGYPAKLDTLVIRLYANNRSDESMEVASVRFRAMTPAEAEAYESNIDALSAQHPVRQYPILGQFLPLGAVLDAEVARRMAELLGVSMKDYWNLALEDIVRHNHNCIAMENADRFTAQEFSEFLSMCGQRGLKVVPHYQSPVSDDIQSPGEFISSYIAPHIDSNIIFAWCLCTASGEEKLQQHLKLKAAVEEKDSIHPVVGLNHEGSGFPLYAPFFSAVGSTYYQSSDPWAVAAVAQQQRAQTRGQQYWMLGPAFVSATGAPTWSTCPEMRLMANLAIANGARGWFSYAYHNAPMWVNGSVQRTLTGPFLAFSDLWLELDKRMARLKALAPLLLTAEPARLPDKWYVTSKRSTDHTALPDGLPAISSYRLRGNDFNVYFVVNNDTRGMTSVFVNIPPEIMKGLEIYDLSDFVTTWNWAPMRLERHIEMFPGQARVILVAKPEVCAYWRDRIAQHLVQDDLQQLSLNLQLARAHGINIGAIEEKLNTTGHGDLLHDLVTTHAIRAMTLNLIYQSPVICEARSRIIEACSAVCGCDGALCRLINKGKKEIARELGMNVLPIAREFTRLRLDLRNGKGGEIREQCEEITKRAQRLLTEIREQAK